MSYICLPKRSLIYQVKYYEIPFILSVQTLCLFELKTVSVQQSWLLDKCIFTLENTPGVPIKWSSQN